MILQENRAEKTDERSREAANKKDKVGKEFWQGQYIYAAIESAYDRTKLT